MNPTTAQKSIIIALLGNPNTGKSTLFSALSGVNQRIGNYPGVTVEKKIGHLHHAGARWTLVDLPGTYSLAPRSPDEMVAVDVLLGRRDDTERPQVVLCIVDATNLERNLYLVSQMLELELPVVVALNMTDLAKERGIEIEVAQLQSRLGVPVIPVQGNRRRGLDELKAALLAAVDRKATTPPSPFPEPFQTEVAKLQAILSAKSPTAAPRYLAERLLLDTSGYLDDLMLSDDLASHREALKQARDRLAVAGCPVPAVEAMARYRWVGQMLEGLVKRPAQRKVTASDKLDQILTHRVWGTLAFLALMFIVFQSVFTWAGPLMELIDSGTGAVGEWLGSRMPEGALRSLVVDGIVAGVGGVIIFLPQILILFLFIGILEDCGYMARAAYLMDKLMTRVGLSGKSFIPMLSSFACAIPGVMAARVIENRRDRLTTILVAPLMSCSARLPVYILLIAAFVPNVEYAGGVIRLQGMVMMSMYLLGIVVAAGVAWLLKGTILRGPTPPFVMELPSYKWPGVRLVLHRMLERGWSFIYRAGTLIVVVSIVVWGALYFPNHRDEIAETYRPQVEVLEQRKAALPDDSPEREAIDGELAEIEHHIDGAQQRQSYLGRMGHAIEPIVRPLGWDWRIGSAVLASFPAREVVVATLGVIYDVGGDVDVESEEGQSRLGSAMRAATWDGTDRPVYNLPVALSIMVFFALCAQCASTLAVIARETNSWRWPIFTFVYMTGLAYIAALVTYQAGMWIAGSGS